MSETLRWKFLPGKGCHLNDSLLVIKKLCSLLQDEAASKMIHRHLILLNEFIQLSKNGCLMKNIPHLTYVLEFLVSHLEGVKEYDVPFKVLLLICRQPPLFEKSSETLYCSTDLQYYFSFLGYFIVLLRDESTQIMVIDVLHCLLTRYKHTEVACVKLCTCISAMEESDLPCIVADLFEVVTPRLFFEVLNLALVMVKSSEKCCHTMIECGALDGLLSRLDPQYYHRDPCYPPRDPIHPESVPYPQSHQTNVSLACHLLWNLLKSVHGIRDNRWVKSPSQHALWSLRFVFRLVTCRGIVETRNDLMGLILFSLDAIPGFLAVESGLADDIAMLSVMSELGAPNSWAERLIFTASMEDCLFKKMLLQALCFLVKMPAAIEILRQRNVMVGVLHIVNPGLTAGSVDWKPEDQNELVIFALRSLSFLVPVLVDQFIENQGSTRTLLMVSMYQNKPYDFEILHSCIRTISSIMALDDKRLANEYRDQGVISVFGYFCKKLLEKHAYSLEYQRVLAHIFFILESLSRGSAHCNQLYGERTIGLVVNFMKRMLRNRPGDSRLDSRLLINVIDLFWEMVVWHPPHLKKFVHNGSFYTLMDTLQRAKFPENLIILSTIVDLVDQGDCVPHLLTWRDADTRNNYKHLLAAIWREEEKRCGVKRAQSGTIADIEVPLMGEDQWYYTFYHKKDPTMSPATIDILGSVRPKIYAIFQLLKQRHSQKVIISENFYRVNHEPLLVEDQLTLQLAENYLALKLGEVWMEVGHYLESFGIKPTGADGDVISVLTQRQRLCAACVLKAQKDIIATAEKEETSHEMKVYSEIKEYKLSSALEAVRQLNSFLCTAEYEVLMTAKKRQTKQVDGSLMFPEDTLEYCRHRTYPRNIGVTEISGEYMIVKSTGRTAAADDVQAPQVEKMLPPKFALPKPDFEAPPLERNTEK